VPKKQRTSLKSRPWKTPLLRYGRSTLGISLLQRTVATAAENLNISKERFDKAQLTNELGGSNSTDLMAAKVDMNRDKVELMEAQTQLESAKNSFAAFIGYEDAFTVSDQTGLNLEEHFDEAETLAYYACR